MDKELVRQKIKSLNEATQIELKANYEQFSTTADLDEADTKDMEDLSHQEEAHDMQLKIRQHLIELEADWHFLKGLALAANDSVEVGSLVKTDHHAFFIAVACHAIDVEGEKVVGISSKAPIFAQMQGKKVGDSFTFNETSYKILGVS